MKLPIISSLRNSSSQARPETLPGARKGRPFARPKYKQGLLGAVQYVTPDHCIADRVLWSFPLCSAGSEQQNKESLWCWLVMRTVSLLCVSQVPPLTSLTASGSCPVLLYLECWDGARRQMRLLSVTEARYQENSWVLRGQFSSS